MALDYGFKPFSGVGIVNFFERLPNGQAGAGYDMGETSTLNITNNSPRVELNTSRSPDRGVAFSMAQNKTGQVSIEMRTLTDFVQALIASGTWTEVAASAAVEGWVAPTGLVALQVIKLPSHNVSAVVVEDSSGAPKTLPAGQYELDAVGGTIKLLDIETGGPYVQPFKVDYTPGAVKVLGGMKATDKEYIIHFNGTNAHDGSRKIVEVYRFRPAPEGEQQLIMTEYGTYRLNGSIQRDETRLASSAGGQYYAIIEPNT